MTEYSARPFEEVRALLSSLEPAGPGSERVVRFVDESKTVGFARDATGRLEIMLSGPELIAHSAAIRPRMLFNEWLTTDGASLHANRLVLEPGPQFDAAGALICVELIKLRFVVDPAAAFSSAEPVIEMVLSHAENEEALITGLAGELSTLDWLTMGLGAKAADALVQMWHGWKPSSRDIQIGSMGVEVKTTTKSASVHHVQGWYQVERGVAVDGSQETDLFLLSIGIAWLDAAAGSGQSIRQLSERIADRLTGAGRARFLAQIRTYGGARLEVDDSGLVMDRAVRRPFMTVFERLYDMSDPRVKVLRAADLAALEHVQSDSVSFTVELPERLRGDLNPINGTRAIVGKLLAEP